jgi:hypothetical protein
MSVRGVALVKLLALVLLAIVLSLVLDSLADGGATLGRWRALPVVPAVLCLAPLLELIIGAPFSQVSASWNHLAGWQQWGIVLLVPVVLLAIFVAIDLVLSGEP